MIDAARWSCEQKVPERYFSNPDCMISFRQESETGSEFPQAGQQYIADLPCRGLDNRRGHPRDGRHPAGGRLRPPNRAGVISHARTRGLEYGAVDVSGQGNRCVHAGQTSFSRCSSAARRRFLSSRSSGASFAAQLGTMQVNEEIDALKTLGISPMEFLVLPRMIALFLMMPLLSLYADLMGILGGPGSRGPLL